MSQYRVQINQHDPAMPDASDDIVNTFYLDSDELPIDGDPDALAADAAELFSSYRAPLGGLGEFTAKIYDMSDAEPRLPIAQHTITLPASTLAGPREVALCLSYYAERNLPRRRGRMFIGPWYKTDMDLRPGGSTRTALQNLAQGISGLGGANVQWVQYSPTTGEFHNVTDYWIDDEWDTIRSRGLKPTLRLTGTVDG